MRRPLATGELHTGLTPASSLSSSKFDRTTSNTDIASPLPELVTKPSPGIDPETLAYLTSRGVFDLPPASSLHNIFECFINYVYPLLPILDLPSLLEDLHGPAPQISLPLLYGIMLAASAFVNQGTLDQIGYRSRFEWRSSLGRKLQVSCDI